MNAGEVIRFKINTVATSYCIDTAAVSGAKDLNGNSLASTVSWPFATIAPQQISLFGNATPAIAASGDKSPLEVGMRFQSTVCRIHESR